MTLTGSIFVFLLFYVLTPGVATTLPSATSSKFMQGLVHAFIFTIIMAVFF